LMATATEIAALVMAMATAMVMVIGKANAMRLCSIVTMTSR
jgi:hypothetical protein